MQHAARLQAAIEVLEVVLSGTAPERALADWARGHRFAGSKDRRAIADKVYDCLRQKRSLAWRWLASPPARAAVLGSVVADGDDPREHFDGRRHGPPALDEAERAALDSDIAPMPDAARLDYPDWLDDDLRRSLGERFEPAMEALRQRAPLDLRVNLLKATVEEAAALLASDGIEARPVPLVATALRCAAGSPLARSRAYIEGVVELQDAASQAAAAFAAARPGETVLDFCAGGGGKTLALAAMLRDEGRVLAHDANPRRMRDLPDRARRAGATVTVIDTADLAAFEGKCDLVFVDAPCSGAGSWRRDPAGKWRLTAAALDERQRTQVAILQQVSRYRAPGGRLVYCLCSFLRREIDSGALALGGPPADTLLITPDSGHDGFFCGAWNDGN
jgi:16S rRNA (cytosine967-C5)-methyltransferase